MTLINYGNSPSTRMVVIISKKHYRDGSFIVKRIEKREMMIKKLMVMAISLLLLAACNQKTTDVAQDFSLYFEWNTGSLPPQYTYSYAITLGPGTQGKLAYQPGYEEDEKLYWEVDFSITEQQMVELYQYLDSQDMFSDKWNEGEPMEGSSSTTLILNNNGKQYNIPNISILDHSEVARVDAAMQAIRDLVPGTIWDEMDARQKEYETSYED